MALNAQPFWDFITERHRIYLKKAAGAPDPWTDDEILRTYSFCNVFRELDKVTVWVREKWREPYANNPQLWIAMCLARQVNWPDTLEEVGFPEKTYDAKAVRAALEARKARGEKVYTGAYMISAPSGEFAGMAKPEYTAHVVVGALWDARHEFEAMFANDRQPTMQEVHTWLRQFRGIRSTFTSVLDKGKVTSTGTVRASAVEKLGARSAKVIVAAHADVTSPKADPQPKDYRFRVSLRKVDDVWKVSDMEFVR